MGWKPKEKPLTAEEAIVLAKKELAPFWHGSTPLVAGVRSGDKISAHPLDKDFVETPRLMVFLDPTDFDGEAAMVYVHEWANRYPQHDLKLLLVFRPPYQFFTGADTVLGWLRKNDISTHTTVAVDADGSLTAAFGVRVLPKVCLVHRNTIISECTGVDGLKDCEPAAQKFLRQTDPGLALQAAFVPAAEALPRSVARLEFGPGRGAVFPAPGFVPGAGGLASASFAAPLPPHAPDAGFAIHGKWMQDAERIATNDPSAAISFRSPGQRIALLAQAVSKVSEPARMVIEVNGSPAYDAIAGEDLVLDETGESALKLDHFGKIYHALHKLPPKDREITLRFPAADRVPVAIYGIRFGN